MGKIKISIVVSVWGTEHLMKNSIKSWAKQNFPKENWELIVIDDNALGDVKSIIEPYRDKINIQYIRFEHSAGMRGNQIAYNTAWMCSAGEYIGESTPETIWTPDFVRSLYELHEGKKDTFVIFKTYNLTTDLQLKINTVDWESDLMNLSKIDGWDNEITQLNKKVGANFGSHQSSSIYKKTWFNMTKNLGFGLWSDYGSDDPEFLGLREKFGISDLVVVDPLLVHQHHLPWSFFAAHGHSPLTNRNNHSIINVWNDISGRVPENGSSEIWDNSSKETLTEKEIEDWKKWDDYFLNSGGDPAYLIDRFEYYKKNCYYL